MSLVIADRVRETSTTIGTGTLTLDGAVASYQSFSAIGNGNTVYYTIVNQSANEWEVGIGTYTASGTTLSRDTVLSSSNSGLLVNFSAGTKDVWGDYPAGKAVTTDTLAYPPAIGGTTPAAATFTTLTATGQTSLGGAAGSESLRAVPIASAINWVEIAGSSGSTPNIKAQGSGTNLELRVSSKGSGDLGFFTNNLAQRQFNIAHTASAVNYVQVTGAATTAAPVISSQGSDSNIALSFVSKGTARVNFFNNGATSSRQFAIGTSGVTTAVNFINVDGSATGNVLPMQAQGTDTNISMAFQSKGTGGISLSTGSTGTNLVNGTTVTAITRTAGGSGYTSAPSVAISAPTTAGGVQATASSTIWLVSAAISSGGTGYTAGDVLTVSGGSFTVAGQITVNTVSAGVITAVTISASGSYTTAPTNPASVTGGTGSGATFTLGFSVNPNGFTITNAGSGYVEQPTVTFSGGGGSGAAAYASVGNVSTIRGLYGGGSQVSLQFAGPAGTIMQLMEGGSGNPAAIVGKTSASSIQFYPSLTNCSFVQSSSGTAQLDFYTNTLNQLQFRVSHTASAVNYVQVTGGATGTPVAISAQGSDSNIRMNLFSKGTESVDILTSGGTVRQARFTNTASTANWVQMTGAAAGSSPVYTVAGSDTNIPLVVQPKGTGALQAQLNDGTATSGNARGANAVDWQTSRVSASAVASGFAAVLSGGYNNAAAGSNATVAGGSGNLSQASNAFVGGGTLNNVPSTGYASSIVGGFSNTASGYFNAIGGGASNSATSGSAVTTQSATMNGTTAVTLSGSNANIKVGQLVAGTSISFPDTYVAAISGTSLTLSKAATGSSTSTLSFFTPHGVVVGGGNNQATGAYSFIGGGGDAGTAANRNAASGDWSVVVGGTRNIASGIGSFVGGGGIQTNFASGNTASGEGSVIAGGLGNFSTGSGGSVVGGYQNVASGTMSSVAGGRRGTTRAIAGNIVFPACNIPIFDATGVSQAAVLVLGRQTTDATATVLASDSNAAGTTNQIILPNNSAYYFKGSVIANVTGAANGAAWSIEGAIMRGANAASTVLIDTPSVNRVAASSGATAWTVSVTADTTNGGLAVTVTGAAATTIRWVAKLETTEVTF